MDLAKDLIRKRSVESLGKKQLNINASSANPSRQNNLRAQKLRKGLDYIQHKNATSNTKPAIVNNLVKGGF